MRPARLGVVAAGHPDTAAAGIAVLRAGGNAADAAVAAACAAMTAETALTGVGAGGFALVLPAQGRPELLDFFAAAPGKGRSPGDLTARQVLAQYLVPFRGTTQLFNVGPSSCAVPGMMPGLARLHETYGRLPLDHVLAPAVRLALEGARLVAQQDYLHDILAGLLTGTPGMRAIFAPQGRLLRQGERVYMPDLAPTLETFAREGAAAFTTGRYAERIAAAMAGGGGLITEEDLATYEVVSREPVHLAYRGYEILSNPLPSSGGTLIAFTLGLLDRWELAPLSAQERALVLVSALEATDSARVGLFNVGMREPGFERRFLAAATLAQYAALATKVARSGDPTPRLDDAPGGPTRGPGILGNTTHISVIDGEGLAVSLTSSCGSGSGVVIEGTGIIMNNMGGEEDLNPGGPFTSPPGERLTSMMAPTVARGTGPDQRLLALGSAGSARLRSAIIQTLVNVVDLDLPAQQAVDAPRLHVDRDTVHLEGGTTADVAEHLKARGRNVNLWPVIDLYFGGVQIGARCLPGGRLEFDGGGDPRRGGVALFA